MFVPEDLDWTTGLVLDAPDLRKLEILNPWDPSSDEAFFSFLDRFASADTPPRLQGLSLSMAQVTGQLLSRVMVRFCDTLQVLTLYDVNIRCRGNWILTLRE
ncbi:hypothetical protein MMC14_000920 [Varicellaria rhodocarpa]|nr:hypothetical protein [Varicellaria rhodocarpa]